MVKAFINKIVFSGILLLAYFNPATAQFDKDYVPIKSSGTLPDEFIRTARSISEEEIKNIPKGKDNLAKQQFAISNNYFLRDLLLSGDVMVNDPLTAYVNKVADQLLKEQPALRSQIKFYVTKSPDVNAYAFDKGFIFVNVGLLAQLENEAQLAFILAHEITHVVKKHAVNQYIEEIKLANGTSVYEPGTSAEERTLAKYRFSKEQESDADIEGLKLVKQSNYSIKALNGAFDVLQYSYLPFELLDFKKSFFEDNDLVMPDTLGLKTISAIKANEDYDDTKSTHPNIRKRRGAIEADLKVDDEASRKKYLVSEEEFKRVREIARFEMCRLYLLEREYVEAIYAGYIQLQKYPENVYLKKIVAKGLYNILVNKPVNGSSFYANNVGTVYMGGEYRTRSGGYSIPDYNSIEGSSQPLYYMLENLTGTELNAVALSFTYKAYKSNKGDKTLSALTDSLFSALVNRNSMFLNDFSKRSKGDIKKVDTIKAVVVEEEQEESKYSKIKKQQEKVEVETTGENFVKYAFVDLLKDEEFVSRYTKMAKGLTAKPLEANEYRAPVRTKKRKKGDAELLGIEKIAFLSPFYMKVKNDHGKESVNFYLSEERAAELAKIEEKCADRLNLQHSSVSIKDLTAGDIKRFNDYAALNEWLSERFKHGDNNEELVTSSEYIGDLIQELGTKYVAWTGVYSVKGKIHRSAYFFILLDIESGKLMKYETRQARSKDNKDFISSMVYNSLMQVAKKPK